MFSGEFVIGRTYGKYVSRSSENRTQRTAFLCDQLGMEPKDRLRTAREAAGFKTAVAAAKANRDININTLTSNENGNRPVSRRMAVVYAKAFNVTPGWLLYGEGEAKFSQVSTSHPSIHPSRCIYETGDVAAGLWLEANLFETEGKKETNYMPDRRYPADAQYIVRVRGESLNKIAQDGDLLLCVDYMRSGSEPKNNDLVIVERTRDDWSTIERTAKRLIISNEDMELRPESFDKRFQTSITYKEGDEDYTTVQIKSKVISVIKPIE